GAADLPADGGGAIHLRENRDGVRDRTGGRAAAALLPLAALPRPRKPGGGQHDQCRHRYWRRCCRDQPAGSDPACRAGRAHCPHDCCPPDLGLLPADRANLQMADPHSVRLHRIHLPGQTPLGRGTQGHFHSDDPFYSTFLLTIVAILGTTISPYLFFWQASEEVEEEVSMGRRRLWERVGATDEELKYAALDVNIGMIFCNIVFYFVILGTAATLHAAGRTDIESAT